MLTTEANSTVATVHDRMPVIIAEPDYDAWLQGGAEVAKGLLVPYREAMRV